LAYYNEENKVISVHHLVGILCRQDRASTKPITIAISFDVHYRHVNSHVLNFMFDSVITQNYRKDAKISDHWDAANLV